VTPVPTLPVAALRAGHRPAGGDWRGSIERTAVCTVAAAFAAQPLLRPSGPGNSSPVDLLTFASLLVAAVWAGGFGHPLRAAYGLPVALIVLGGTIAAVLGPLPNISLIAIIQDLVLFAWATTVVNVGSSVRAMRAFLVTWSYSSIGWAVVPLAGVVLHVTAITGVNAQEGNRVPFTFGDPNYAAIYWVLSIFVVHAIQAPRRSWQRGFGYLLLFVALVLTESNGGMLEFAAGLATLTVAAAYRRRGMAAAVTLIAVVVISATAVLHLVPLAEVRRWALESHQPLVVNSIGRSDQSATQRQQLVGESLQLYNTNHISGIGPGTTKALLSRLGYPYAKEAHDDYLAAFVERGPIGLAGVLLLACVVVRWTVTTPRQTRAGPLAAAVPRPMGVVAALTVIASADLYYEVLHFRFVWALFAIVAVLGSGRVRVP
jgi:O-Antigen ligase